MLYNRKTTEYALLPLGPFPLDARSHFKNFAEANSAIVTDRVGKAETAKQDMINKRYYVGQIITTTDNGSWQIDGVSTEVKLYVLPNGSGVYWNQVAASNKTNFAAKVVNNQIVIYATQTDLENSNEAAIVGRGAVPTPPVAAQIKINTYLIPLNGSGGGSASLTLNPNGGLVNTNEGLSISYGSGLTIHPGETSNEPSTLTLSIDANSALTTTNNQLTLNVGPGLTTTNNQLTLNVGPGLKLDSSNTLTINTGSGLQFSGNKLEAVGVHTTIVNDSELNNIKIDDYVYQRIE